MSAWIVSKRHIDAMISAAMSDPARQLRWRVAVPVPAGAGEGEFETRTIDAFNADAVGAMLWEENVKSVDFRYSEKNHVPKYKYAHCDLSPVAVLKQIACYEYQSCEHPEWNDSEARAFCDALRTHLIPELPGYDSAPWGIDDV